jgi:putative transposase
MATVADGKPAQMGRPGCTCKASAASACTPHRPIDGQVKTVSVTRDGDRWYLGLSCDGVAGEPVPAVDAPVGIDLGVASFLTTSDGRHIGHPQFLAKSAERLALARRDLARCQSGSTRRQNAVARVAAIHRKIRRQRRDHAYKIARDLVERHDVICHEALRIANMTRSARGTVEEPGRNVAQKAGLNRSILDASWGLFLPTLARKAESTGRLVIAVNPANTSRTCPACGMLPLRTASVRPCSSAPGADSPGTPT